MALLLIEESCSDSEGGREGSEVNVGGDGRREGREERRREG